jgi:hypothetical protein
MNEEKKDQYQEHRGVKRKLSIYTKDRPSLLIKKAPDQPNETCVICFQELTKDVSTTKWCGRHMYHRECLSKWLQEHNTCPLCNVEAKGMCGEQMDGEMIIQRLSAPFINDESSPSTIKVTFQFIHEECKFLAHMYLPENEIGVEVTRALGVAFQYRYLFCAPLFIGDIILVFPNINMVIPRTSAQEVDHHLNKILENIRCIEQVRNILDSVHEEHCENSSQKNQPIDEEPITKRRKIE